MCRRFPHAFMRRVSQLGTSRPPIADSPASATVRYEPSEKDLFTLPEWRQRVKAVSRFRLNQEIDAALDTNQVLSQVNRRNSTTFSGEGDADQDERQCQQGLQVDGIGEIQGAPENAEQRHQVTDH